MLVYGFHAVGARLKINPESVQVLYVDRNRIDMRMRQTMELAQRAGVKIHTIETGRLDSMCPNRKHQGVVAEVTISVAKVDLDDLLDRVGAAPFLLLLDGVTDPRNLGACLRVADGAGVHAVIAPKDHSCQLNDAAIQTASGAAESVPYIQVTNLARTIDELQDRQIWVVGTSDQAEKTAYDLQIPSAVAWVLGAEGTGLRRLTTERCDELVSIPMRGQVSSLNVSVAAGVLLYESVRQFSCRKT